MCQCVVSAQELSMILERALRVLAVMGGGVKSGKSRGWYVTCQISGFAEHLVSRCSTLVYVLYSG